MCMYCMYEDHSVSIDHTPSAFPVAILLDHPVALRGGGEERMGKGSMDGSRREAFPS